MQANRESTKPKQYCLQPDHLTLATLAGQVPPGQLRKAWMLAQSIANNGEVHALSESAQSSNNLDA